MKKAIVNISVDDVEKRTIPDKHYEYVIRVKWNDGRINVIYRRYSRFYELQCKLLDNFLKAGGIYDPKDRILPFLPGKIIFGRSHTRKVALNRLEPINQYCKRLIELPDHISQSKFVLQFFETCPEDLLPVSDEPIAVDSDVLGEDISDPILLEQYNVVVDYKKDGRNETSLKAGWSVEVVEKSETGWWFVRTEEGQGWVPSSYLEKPDGSVDDRLVPLARSRRESKYVCTHSYSAQEQDEVKIDKGCFVEVLEKNLDGWWVVRYKGKVGKAPASYLTKTNTLKVKRILRRTFKSRDGPEIVTDLTAVSTIPTLQERYRNSNAVADEAPNNNKQQQLANRHLAGAQFRLPLRSPVKQEGRFQKNPALLKSNNIVSPPASIVKENLQARGVPDSVWTQEREDSDSVSSDDDNDFDDTLSSDGSENIPIKLPPRKETLKRGIAASKLKEFSDKNKERVDHVYVAIADFENTVGDGINLSQSEELIVLEKTDHGWWLVQGKEGEGWAPATYIQKQEKTVVQHNEQKPLQSPPPPLPIKQKSPNANNFTTQRQGRPDVPQRKKAAAVTGNNLGEETSDTTFTQQQSQLTVNSPQKPQRVGNNVFLGNNIGNQSLVNELSMAFGKKSNNTVVANSSNTQEIALHSSPNISHAQPGLLDRSDRNWKTTHSSPNSADVSRQKLPEKYNKPLPVPKKFVTGEETKVPRPALKPPVAVNRMPQAAAVSKPKQPMVTAKPQLPPKNGQHGLSNNFKKPAAYGLKNNIAIQHQNTGNQSGDTRSDEEFSVKNIRSMFEK